MTLEILIQNTEPADVDTGTYLTSTKVLSVEPIEKVKLYKSIGATGLPITIPIGSQAPTLSFSLIIEERGTTDLTTASLGLQDLDVLRKAAVGYNGSTTGNTVWIRDTEGDYFIRHWKGGTMAGLKPSTVKGYPNIIGNALYAVTFTLLLKGDVDNASHSLIRWL